MFDPAKEYENRVEYIKKVLASSGARGIVFGNSGGKDSALVGALCKAACDNTLGVIMPCGSSRNFGSDKEDGLALAQHFGIETRIVDLTPVKESMMAALDGVTELTKDGSTNINPRLRMTTLYAIGASEGRLVAGTGNRNEIFMGYFTKWGDGAFDFNPIADLSVSQIYGLLTYLNAPENIIKKAPSAGLFEGQTDEAEMGVTYAAVNDYMDGLPVSAQDRAIIERYHSRSEHKRKPALKYPQL